MHPTRHHPLSRPSGLRGARPVRDLLAIAALLSLAARTPGAESADSLPVALTADTRGAPRPCASCDEGTPGAELARRLSLVRTLRDPELPLLLLDAGNAFFGREDPEAPRQPVVVAYEALGYDAVNISYRDLRRGRESLERIVAEAEFPLVSASILDANSREPIARPWVVVEKGGRRVGVIGATGLPAGVDQLPHLAEQLAGVRIDPPLKALAKHLPALEKESETIVVLYYGTAEEAGRIHERFGERISALLVGGVDATLLPMVGSPPLAGAAEGGSEIAIGVVELPRGGGVFRRLAVSEAIPPDPELEARLAALAPEREPAEGADSGDGATRRLPLSPWSGEPIELRVEGRNRGLSLAVRSAKLTPAPDDSLLLELDTVWENRLPLDLIYGLEYGEGGSVSNLPRQLFLLVDGHRVARVDETFENADGHLPRRFSLPEPGARHEGKVVFPLRGGGDPPFRTLELRFYSQSFAPIFVRLTEASDVPGSEEPAVAEGAAAMVRMSLHGAEVAEELAGRRAPEGMEWVVADLRGRSLIEREVDARALDPGAPADAKARIGIVYEYLRSRETLHLLVDGSYACSPRWDVGSLPEDPPFFPDVNAGGELTFLVPAGATRLELCCFFPETRLTTGEGFGVPEPICFTIRGGEPDRTEKPPLATFSDDPVPVEVTGYELSDRFAGERSVGGKRWVVVDLRLKNTGDEPGLYKIDSRFRLQAGGEKADESPHPASATGPRAPPDPLWLPVGAQRSFQLAFQVPAGAKSGRLVHTGIERQSVFELSLGTGGGEPRVATRGVEPGPEPPGTGSPPPGEEPSARGEEPAPGTSLDALLNPGIVPKGLEGVGVTAREVNEAIDRGREFLWRHILEEDLEGKLETFPGDRTHTIAALALVHCGGDREFPDFDLVLRGWLGGEQAAVDPPPNAARQGRYAAGRTYGASVFCMTADAYDEPLFFPFLGEMAATLVEGQYENGSWGYGIPRPEAAAEAVGASRPLRVLGDASGGARLVRETPYEARQGDNSTSQFALLGLRSAARRGYLPPADTWKRAQRLYEARQSEAGGWSYTSGSGYGSMTCSGVCSILLSRWGLGEPRPAEHGPIVDGLRWLADRFTVSSNPDRGSQYLFYYLYSLERTGRLFDTEFIGKNEWYPQGVRQLLSMQLDDGGWKEKKDRVAPTAFALLFLTRATEKLVEAERKGPGSLRVVSKPLPESRLYFILDASGSMQGRMEGRSKFEVATAALESLVRDLPESQSVALRVYGHRYSALDEEAATDTELEVPMDAWTADHRSAFLARVRSLRPRGRTPLALSIERAAADVARLRGRGRTTVVLLTDGGEDATSLRDPVEAARRIERLRDVDLVVIGFDIGNADWSAQLRGIAEAGHGTYWPANRPGTLDTALHVAARRPPRSYDIYAEGGGRVDRVALGDVRPLDPGSYVVETVFGASRIRETVRIRPGRPTTVVVDPSALRPGGQGAAAAPPAATGPAATGGGERPPATTAPAATAPPAAERPAPTIRFCTQCGHRASPGANFCTQCGTRLRAPAGNR